MFQNSLSRRRLITLAGAGALGAAMGNGLRMPQAHAALADQYELIDLGVTSPSEEMRMTFNDMNSLGIVVGNMYIDAEKNSPWIFQDGKMSKIKTGKYGARVSCINDSGVMGGRDLLGWHNADQPFGQPVLWIDGEKQVMPYPDGLPSPAEEGRVFDINNDGVAVGDVSIAGGTTFPVIWRNGNVELLPMPESNARGTARYINNPGIILGDVNYEATDGGAFWTPTGLVMVERSNPEQAPGAFMFAGFDNRGVIYGQHEVGSTYYAAYLPSNFSPLETFAPVADGAESSFMACSDDGSLMGGGITIGGKQHAAVWNNGEEILLKSLVKNARGLRMTGAFRITPDGLIGGTSIDGDGALHPYQLVPA